MATHREFGHYDPRRDSTPHACNAPGLSPLEFLRRVYLDPSFPMSIRIDAARGLLPYTEPRPASSPSSHIGCTIVIGGIPDDCARATDHGSVAKDPEQINANSQSKSRIRPDNPQPSSETPGPTNIETNSYPPTFIDYSKPPTADEIQQIKATINELRPDLAHLPTPEFHLCPCGHWITGSYPCCERSRDPSKMN